MTMGLVHAAQQLEAYGRGPDKSLAHITPAESAMLDYVQGGRRENPVTGLPEYSLFGKVLKSVARIAATVGAGVVSGWNPYVMAAANGAATKLTGGSWKQAAIGAATTGLTAGTMGPGSFSQSPVTALKEGALGAGANAAGVEGLKTAGIEGVNANIGQLGADAVAPTLGQQGLSYLGTKPGLTIAAATGLSALSDPKKNGAPPPTMAQQPYDPTAIFPWLRRPSQMVGQMQGAAPIQMPQIEQPQYFADGGPAGVGVSPQQLMTAAQWGYINAKRGGKIRGPGDGKSDEIPALLSNNEHVIDAATVADAGNGDSDAGHAVIEKIKQRIRANAGRKNPSKPTPRQPNINKLMKQVGL